MSKLLQSGDLDINFDRIFTCKNAYLQKSKPFFDAQGGRAYRNRPFRCRVARSTSTLTAYLLHKLTTRFRVISNGGRQNPPAKAPGKPGERQAGRQAARQAGRRAGGQAGHQATSQAGRQPGKQARRQADAIQGDLGQFLRLGKNPLCLAAYLGKNHRKSIGKLSPAAAAGGHRWSSYSHRLRVENVGKP